MKSLFLALCFLFLFIGFGCQSSIPAYGLRLKSAEISPCSEEMGEGFKEEIIDIVIPFIEHLRKWGEKQMEEDKVNLKTR